MTQNRCSTLRSIMRSCNLKMQQEAGGKPVGVCPAGSWWKAFAGGVICSAIRTSRYRCALFRNASQRIVVSRNSSSTTGRAVSTKRAVGCRMRRRRRWRFRPVWFRAGPSDHRASTGSPPRVFSYHNRVKQQYSHPTLPACYSLKRLSTDGYVVPPPLNSDAHDRSDRLELGHNERYRPVHGHALGPRHLSRPSPTYAYYRPAELCKDVEL